MKKIDLDPFLTNILFGGSYSDLAIRLPDTDEILLLHEFNSTHAEPCYDFNLRIEDVGLRGVSKNIGAILKWH